MPSHERVDEPHRDPGHAHGASARSCRPQRCRQGGGGVPGRGVIRVGLPYRQYKGARPHHRETRHALVDQLRARAPWLVATHAEDWERIRENDHELDALVASLVARAKACGLCDDDYDATSENARSEGWIALPVADALDRLAPSATV
jgi:Protein of unknown function (DUF429)